MISNSASLLPAPAALSTGEQKQKQTSQNRLIILIAGAVLLVIAGIVGGLLAYYLSNPSKETIPTPSSDESSDQPGASKFESLGCFNDESVPALSIHVGSSFTVQKCFEYALQHQYAYFGLENGGDCYVGNDNYAVYGAFGSTASVPALFTPTPCESTCSDGSDGPCGGEWSLSAYKASAVSVSCSSSEFYASVNNGSGVCLACGSNSSSQGGQSSVCSCSAGYKNWTAGLGCSS